LKIFIDADGCPVVEIAVKIAKERNIPVVLVKNYSHILSSDYAEIVTVDNSMDSADYYIVNNLSKGDIVITQDNGLAAMVLSRKAYPISQNGTVIDDENIGWMLSSRHISRELRVRGIYTTKAKKRDKLQDDEFKDSLIALIEKLKRGN